MALTQQRIINKIPNVFYEHMTYGLRVFSELINSEWPNSELGEKVTAASNVLDDKEEFPVRLNKETWTFTKVKCLECHDSGLVFNFKVPGDLNQYPCTGCTANVSANGA